MIRRGHSAAGFTLTELAIVLGCITILASVVITMRGFIIDAQTKSTFAKMASIHRASHAWSKRARAGQGYSGGNRFPGRTLSIPGLIADGLLQNEDPGGGMNVWGDWRVSLPPIRIGPTGPAVPGVGQTQFFMRLCAPNAPTSDDLNRMSAPWNTVSRQRYQGGCPCATCGFEFILE